MRMLYKYPQAAFPYRELVEENRRRGMAEPEFELLDTGVFADGCYFDIEIEYGKADPDDILMRVTICNRAAEAAKLHVLPQLWARNIWSWQPHAPKPLLRAGEDGAIAVEHPQLPPLRLYCDGRPELLFCENETNFRRLYGINSAAGTFKDGINDYIVYSDKTAVNPERVGTKAAAHYHLDLAAGESARLRLRLAPAEASAGLADFDRCSPGGGPRPTNSMRRCSATSPIPMPASSSARHSPACYGRSNSIISTFRNGSTATRCCRRRRQRAATAAMPTGGI